MPKKRKDKNKKVYNIIIIKDEKTFEKISEMVGQLDLNHITNFTSCLSKMGGDLAIFIPRRLGVHWLTQY